MTVRPVVMKFAEYRGISVLLTNSAEQYPVTLSIIPPSVPLAETARIMIMTRLFSSEILTGTGSVLSGAGVWEGASEISSVTDGMSVGRSDPTAAEEGSGSFLFFAFFVKKTTARTAKAMSNTPAAIAAGSIILFFLLLSMFDIIKDKGGTRPALNMAISL